MDADYAYKEKEDEIVMKDSSLNKQNLKISFYTTTEDDKKDEEVEFQFEEGFDYDEGECPMSEDSDNDERSLQKQSTFSRHESKSRSNQDQTEMKSKQKQEEKSPEHKDDEDWIIKLHKSLAVDKSHDDVRWDTIHTRALMPISTDDVLDFFEDFSPVSIEWINDCTCNVVWTDDLDAGQALQALSFSIDEVLEMDAEDLCCSLDDIPTGHWRISKNKGWTIFLRYASIKSDRKSKTKAMLVDSESTTRSISSQKRLERAKRVQKMWNATKNTSVSGKASLEENLSDYVSDNWLDMDRPVAPPRPKHLIRINEADLMQTVALKGIQKPDALQDTRVIQRKRKYEDDRDTGVVSSIKSIKLQSNTVQRKPGQMYADTESKNTRRKKCIIDSNTDIRELIEGSRNILNKDNQKQKNQQSVSDLRQRLNRR